MSDDRATVLVVDDDSQKRDVLGQRLGREGFAVLFAADPHQACLEALNRSVDLVLVELRLNGAIGLETVHALRTLEGRADLPVTVLTELSDAAHRLAALELGVDDYLQHPIDDAELKARLKRSVGRKRRLDGLLEESQKLQHLSVTDGLTQVYNHRFFQDRLKEEFRRAQRYDDPLALILLDVDHFKQVNDRYGHPIGDLVLKDVAKSLVRNVRETDLLARYGGEEFAVILPKTHLAGSLTVAERIWRDFGAMRSGPEGNIQVTASLGVAGYPGRGVVSSELLIRSADEALYRSKREGRNKISLAQQPGFLTDPAAKAS